MGICFKKTGSEFPSEDNPEDSRSCGHRTVMGMTRHWRLLLDLSGILIDTLRSLNLSQSSEFRVGSINMVVVVPLQLTLRTNHEREQSLKKI